MLVGVDAKTRATRWQRSAASVFGQPVERADFLEVGGGAVYLQLPWQLASLDAKTGDLRWTAKQIGQAPDNVTLTATRLYLVAGDPVDAYDVASGKLEDVSAALPGGVVMEHQGLIALANAPGSDLLVGLAHPSSDIVLFDTESVAA